MNRLTEAQAALAAYRADQTTEPPNLFTATEARDSAIARISDTWRGEAFDGVYATVVRLAQERESFTADDVHDILPSHYSTVDMRLLGAVLRLAARNGVIEATHYAPSRRRHGSPIRVWRRGAPNRQRGL